MGTDFSAVEGTGSSGVMIVAEASGEMEARDQLPLRPYAPAGSVLQRTFSRMGLDRKMFSLTNCIRCRPKNNWLEGAPWEFHALNHCRPNLDRAIAERRPRAILALGNVATRELTGLAGEALGVGHLMGYVLPSKTIRVPINDINDPNDVPWGTRDIPHPDAIPVIPALHPAFIRRGKASHQGVFSRNLQRAVNVAAGKDREWIWDLEEAKRDGRIRYSVHPSLDEVRAFALRVRANSGLVVSYDIETYESASLDEDARDGFTDTRIRLVQFSTEQGYGIATPWEGEFKQLVASILQSSNIKCGYNLWLFDNKVLAACGAREGLDLTPRGTIHDTLQMFHHWQPDLPAHLQFAAQFVQFPFPWKHLAGTDLSFYGCLTGESRVMLADNSSMKIEDIVRKKLPVVVRTMDKNGYTDCARVIGWRRVKVEGQKWLKLKTEATDQPLYLTPDHEVWCNDDWVEAKDVKVGDIVRSSRFGERDLIHGTLLGDSHCDKRGRLSFTHCEKQREWFDAKRFAFGLDSFSTIKVKPRKVGGRVVGGGSTHYRAEAWVSPTLWRGRFYNHFGDKLFVPPSDAALAVWYCDDGCWAASSKSRERGWLGNPRISVHTFANLDFLIDWFKQRFGWANVSFYPDERCEQGGSVALTGTARHEFFAAVAPYVPISMQYKLPPQYRGRYCGWLSQPKAQETIVASVNDYDPGKRNRDYRYCVTVDHPEHRFFAMGGLVKNCVDVDATLRLYQFLVGMLQRDQIWCGRWSPDGWNDGGYIGQVAQVRPILAAMEDRGLPVNDRERLKLDAEFDRAQQDLDGELQQKVPQEILNVHPRRGRAGNYSYGYVHPPKDTTGLVQRDFREAAIGEDGEPSFALVTRWCRVEPFNPNSWQQLLAYMDARGHKRPKSRKSENEDGSPKDTTEKKELIRLAQRHSDTFYLKVIEYRELSKMRGTYIDGFKPHADGKVHTTFGFDTGTGQLAAKNPNVTNFPKHVRLAKQLRKMIAAPAGEVLVECDFKSYHVLTTGFCAEDPSYMRMARLDMHSFVAGCFLKTWGPEIIEESDDELAERFQWFKSDSGRKYVRDKQAKPTILGVGFGMGAKRLYQENLEHFSGEKTARSFLDLLQHIFPRVFAWQAAVRKLAHEQTYLKSPFGHIRRFYEVFVWDPKKGQWRNGDQAEEAVAFLPANYAFGNIRETLKELARLGLDRRYGLCNSIHDSFVWCFPKDQLEGFMAEVPPVLTAPSKVLIHPMLAPGGLSVDVEVAVGENWSSMSTVEVPHASHALAV